MEKVWAEYLLHRAPVAGKGCLAQTTITAWLVLGFNCRRTVAKVKGIVYSVATPSTSTWKSEIQNGRVSCHCHYLTGTCLH